MTTNAERKRRLSISRSTVHSIQTALVFGFSFLFAVAATAEQPTEVDLDKLVNDARQTFRELVSQSDSTRAYARQAHAILIIPNYSRVGLLLGGFGGHGVLVVRDGGEWAGPAFYDIGRASVGLQVGFEYGKAVSFVMTEEGRDALITDSFKLGGSANAVAGQFGVGINEKADSITFASSKGAFAGISLDGATSNPKDKFNEQYYGQSVSPVDILVRRNVSNAAAAGLLAEIKRATKVGN